jgi:hypothetical protein
VGGKFFRDVGAEGFAVHGQSRAGGDAESVGGFHDEASRGPKLRVKEPFSVCGAFAAEGIGAHKLREFFGVVGRGHFGRPHLKEAHGKAQTRQGPGRLRSGQARSHHDDRFHSSTLNYLSFLSWREKPLPNRLHI